jgi:hypothetical protein
VKEGKYAYIAEKSLLEIMASKDCELHIAKEEFLPLQYGVGLPNECVHFFIRIKIIAKHVVVGNKIFLKHEKCVIMHFNFTPSPVFFTIFMQKMRDLNIAILDLSQFLALICEPTEY